MFSRKKNKADKPVRIPTARYLENVAVYYVQRYAATTASLRRVLQRRVQNAVRAHVDFNAAPCAAWIDNIISKFVSLGYVNDAAFAEQKTASLRRKGASARQIQGKLREKGLQIDLDTDADAELAAARRYVKRKRLGIYRTRTVDNAALKDLDSLARAGFSRAIAFKALQAEDSTID